MLYHRVTHIANPVAVRRLPPFRKKSLWWNIVVENLPWVMGSLWCQIWWRSVQGDSKQWSEAQTLTTFVLYIVDDNYACGWLAWRKEWATTFHHCTSVDAATALVYEHPTWDLLTDPGKITTRTFSILGLRGTYGSQKCSSHSACLLRTSSSTWAASKLNTDVGFANAHRTRS